LLREGFLQQDATDDVDTFASIEKQIRMLALILEFHERGARLVEKGCPIVVIRDLPVVDRMVRIKHSVRNDALEMLDETRTLLNKQMAELDQRYA